MGEKLRILPSDGKNGVPLVDVREGLTAIIVNGRLTIIQPLLKGNLIQGCDQNMIHIEARVIYSLNNPLFYFLKVG